MLKNLLLVLSLLIITNTAYSYKQFDEVTIGSPKRTDPAAVLEINSTVGGFLMPRMTTVERDLLAAPTPTGLSIYNTTTASVEVYSGGSWTGVGGSGGLSEWVTATDYVIDSIVHMNNHIYKSLTVHTSGVFATDLANNEWVELSDSDDIKAILSSTDHALVRWDLTTGAVVQDSTVIVGDTGAITGIESLAVGGALDATSILDVVSTTHGTRPCPTMTEVQRDAIVTPATSLCIFNSDTTKLNIYDGATWASVGGGLDAWVTGTDYKIGNVVHESNLIYLALTDHTSGTFATDLTNNEWIQLSDYSHASSIIYDDTSATETVEEILDETINKGILDSVTVTDDGGLNISWSVGEIFDRATSSIVETTASSGVKFWSGYY